MKKKNCSSNIIFTLIKQKELITPFNNEQTFNTTISKYNFSENESSPIKEFHSENVKKTKETILENIMEFTKNCKKIIMLDIENNNNIDPFQKEYFDELKVEMVFVSLPQNCFRHLRKNDEFQTVFSTESVPTLKVSCNNKQVLAQCPKQQSICLATVVLYSF
jgi:hypothetical protein